MSTAALEGCDCHVHIFDPQRFAYAKPRRFTPGPATVQQLQLNLKLLGLARAVLVQPSVYGDDNACLLDALQAMGNTARGVAVVSANTQHLIIEELDAAGVCGARLNLVVDHMESTSEALYRLHELEALIPDSWHVQLHVSPKVFSGLAGHIERSSRNYVLDHFGLPDVLAVARGRDCGNWAQQLELVQTGRLYVKLSAPYLISRAGAPYDDLAPLVASLLKAHPDGVLWGSNWPHTQGRSRAPETDKEAIEAVESFRVVDDLVWLRRCEQWTAGGGASDSKAISLLADNAKRLYGFA